MTGMIVSSAAQASMIRDTEIEAGLESMIAPLVNAAGYSPGSITVRILLDNEYNAFVAGKLTIYVNSGLILDSESVLEFLGVMAHEIGHLKSGHVQRLEEEHDSASGAAALATIAAIAVAAGGDSDAAAGVLLGGTDQANRHFLSSVRRNEAVADEIGLNLLEENRLSAIGLRNLMQRLSRQRSLPESRQSVYYSTHPGASQRLQTFQDHVDRSPHSGNPASESSAMLYDRLATKLYAWTETPQRIINQQGGESPSAIHRDYALSIAAYRRGDLSGALDHIDTLIRQFPNDPYYLEFRGDILFASGDPDTAALAYEEALNLRPKSPLIQLNLGRSLVAAGGKPEINRAILLLRDARDGEPTWAFTHRQFGIALGKAGRLAEADLALADEAVLLGDNARAIKLAKRALKRGNLDDVLESRANDIIFRYTKPKS